MSKEEPAPPPALSTRHGENPEIDLAAVAAKLEEHFSVMQRQAEELSEAQRKLAEAVDLAEKEILKAAQAIAIAKARQESKTLAMDISERLSRSVMSGRTFAVNVKLPMRALGKGKR